MTGSYTDAARKAVRRLLAQLDHETADNRRFLERENDSDTRAGLEQRAVDPARERLRLEAVIDGTT